MQLSDFYFDLPNELIAHYPTKTRSACKLLSLDAKTGAITHGVFTDILSKINANDLLIFNDTKVIPARVYGKKESGGKIEILVERILPNNRALAHIKASKSPKEGSTLYLGEQYVIEVTMLARHDALFELQFPSDVLETLNRIGHMPLPPYISREDEEQDKTLYQTVYHKTPGAVAAPTAGLHFDEPLLDALKNKGVQMAFVTLHVGAGTFQPVRVSNILEHKMHAEYASVSKDVVDAINECKKRGGRVIAVGTTSVRALESAALKTGQIAPFFDDTQIFITPGYEFKVIDALITNFHLPESTLIMLVSAFAGYDQVMHAYNEAINKKYRFFSYGDAMFIAKS